MESSHLNTSKRKRGRPKGAHNLKQMVQKFASTKINVGSQEGLHQVTRIEALLLKLQVMAMGGDVSAAKYRDEMFNKYSSESLTTEGGYLLASPPIDPETWIKQQQALNHLRERPGGELTE